MTTNSIRPIRFGVLGTARIATRVAAAIRTAANANLHAVGSRSLEKAGAWAQAHSAAKSYRGYQAVLDDPDVDAVYIPLPPSMHAEWTIKAAERNKHVLCEKPLAMNAAEAREMAAACRSNGVQLMDGVMWTHTPRAAAIQQVVRSGTLGRLRRVTAAFSFCWDPIPASDLRFQAALGGGALFDLGWYCVGLANRIFSETPHRAWGSASWSHGVDRSLSAMLWYSDDRVASFDCGFNTVTRRWFEAAGTTGNLVCDDFIRPWAGRKPRFWTHDANGAAKEHPCEDRLQELCLIETFCSLIQSGQLDQTWPERAVQTQTVCDALLRSARSGTPITLDEQ